MKFKGSWLVNYCIKYISTYRKAKRKHMPLPFSCVFSVTANCTSRCKMCNFWQRKSENELTAEEIKNIFSNRFFNNLEAIALTGGDPFLRPDLIDIIDILYSRVKKPIGMGASGLLPGSIDEVLKKCKGKISCVHLSIDGPEDVHNYIRGRKDSFKKTAESLDILKKHGIEPGVTMTITRDNYKHILATKNQFKDCGFSFKLAQHSKFYFGNNETTDFGFSDEEKGHIMEQISRIPRDNLYDSFMDDWILCGKRPLPCYAGRASFYLDSLGNLHPCIHKAPFGNLRTGAFEEIWCSPAAVKFRKTHMNCEECYERCTVDTFAMDEPVWVIKHRMKK